MAMWKEQEGVSAVPEERTTTVGKGSEFEGKLVVKGTLRIDGLVRGQIQVEGTLVVGPGAEVFANVVSETIRIEGSVTGEVKATSSISLLASARVKGSVEGPTLSIERGAILDGTCKMQLDGANVVPIKQPAAVPAAVSQRPPERPASTSPR